MAKNFTMKRNCGECCKGIINVKIISKGFFKKTAVLQKYYLNQIISFVNYKESSKGKIIYR